MNLFHHSPGGDWEERSRRTAAADLPKPYKTLTETDLKNLQESDISTVSAALSVPRGLACSLLLSNRWDLHSACDKWLSAAVTPPMQGSTSKHVICNICFEKFRPSKMAAGGCGHLFCLKCWSSYIGNSINDGAACLTLSCPESGCGAAVTFEMVERFAPVTKIKKYRRLLRRSYVELNPNRKWCPAPECNLAIEFEFDGSMSREVVCACSYTFCFLCAVEGHRPVSCKVAAAWLATNKSEAKSAAWIVSNTKPCPKCHRPIQKNQGCNHMICGAPCRFHFCWNCLSPMSNHDVNCRSLTAEEKGKMKIPMSDVARYAHHCERWEFYENSGKAAVGDLQRARGLCGDGKLGFVAVAWEQIVACRRVLKWSCAFGYHVAEAALLEYLRGEAEAAVGMLQRCAEEAMGDEGVYVDEGKLKGFEVRILDLTRVMRRCFDTLVSASENWLTEVGSSKTGKPVTRPVIENSKGRIGSSKTSKPQRSSETRPGYESSKGNIGSSKTSKPQRSSETRPGYKNSNRIMYFFSTSDSDSDSDSLSSDSGSESEEPKRLKYSTFELEKLRWHNSSSIETGESSKYEKSRM
ncbi:probable E3 ubiquitin-protein ligase ARI11 [Salvia hispanica]|uniref:probable E3 ubiquitin-protein ligase ARI11 n=1 Tax=Salvia hispanica TaxID=49212 RepID=UPI00200903B9|nr:probable E3 ubiquitin-protein ligase ARI11 [Salvia hispanica]